MWLANAEYIFNHYGSEYVNWDEKFYICPDCFKRVYEQEWKAKSFHQFYCPFCEYR